MSDGCPSADLWTHSCRFSRGGKNKLTRSQRDIFSAMGVCSTGHMLAMRTRATPSDPTVWGDVKRRRRRAHFNGTSDEQLKQQQPLEPPSLIKLQRVIPTREKQYPPESLDAGTSVSLPLSLVYSLHGVRLVESLTGASVGQTHYPECTIQANTDQYC